MNTSIKNCLIILFLFTFNNLSFSDDFKKISNIKFTSYTVEDGLSNNVVYSIVQDKLGYMWFGTDDRLNRFDGYKFINFENNPNDINSISSNSASNIYLDRFGILWIGTWGGGLEKYDYLNKKFIHYKSIDGDLTSISDNRVQTLYHDTKNNLWIGTYKGGLNKLNLNTGKITRYKHDQKNSNSISHNRVWSITEDKKGNILIGTSNALNYFDSINEKFISHYINKIQPLEVRTIFIDINNAVWLGTDNGLYLFNINDRSFKQYIPINYSEKSPFKVNSILEDNHNNIFWLGTSNGLYKFNSKTKKFINSFRSGKSNFNSINYNDVRAVYKDRSGLIWLGTRGGGVNVFNPNIVFSYISDFTDETDIDSIIEDKDSNLWIGKNQKLYFYNTKNQTTIEYPEIIISCSFIDSSNNVWHADNKGSIFKYDYKEKVFLSYKISNSEDRLSNSILTLGEDKDKNILIGTYGNGLFIFNPETFKILKHIKADNSTNSISGNEIYSLFNDSKNNLWVGTNSGLNLYDYKENKFYKHSDGYVYSVYEDKNSDLWFGSRKGLYYMQLDINEKAKDIKSRLKLYDTKKGLPNNMVYGILDDNNNNLWLSTDFGISKFNPKNLSFKNYSSKDGLQGNKFNINSFFKGKSGELFFGGTKGITSFYPNKIKENDNKSNIVITDFKKFEKSVIFDKPVNEIENINLSYKDVFFSFDFAILDYKNSAKNSFWHKLEGFDKKWINNSNRNYVRYTNINPGRYTFMLKGTNSDGYPVGNTSKINITINPPWWEKLIFKASIFLSLFILFISFYLFRINSLKKYNKKLELEVKERTKELAQSNEKLSKLVNVDGLTELANRRYLDEYIKKEWRRSKREKSSISILFIDIDFFKQYNDFYGHILGDKCLFNFAKILKTVIKRPADLACRYGGEEFCIVLPDTEADGARYIAEAIQKKLNKLNIPHEKSSAAKSVTCSIGIASYVPTDNFEINNLIDWADNALYRAKNKGRNRIEFAFKENNLST